VPHTYRKTVATQLDRGGLSARTIADQLGHARISMTQDVYLGRRAVDEAAALTLESLLDATEPEADDLGASSGEGAHSNERNRIVTVEPAEPEGRIDGRPEL
jgi:hypothetical protein